MPNVSRAVFESDDGGFSFVLHVGVNFFIAEPDGTAPLARHASAHLFVKEGSAFAFRSLTSTICLCQALFIALAYRLELNVEESRETGGYDD